MSDKKHEHDNNYEKVATDEGDLDIKKENEEEKAHQKAIGFGVRHVQAILLFTSLSIGFVSRGHLGMTIVAMTDVTHSNTNITSNDTFPLKNYTNLNNETNEFIQEDFINNNKIDNATETHVDNKQGTVYQMYDWPKPKQEIVLSAFYVGYSIMMFPMGLISQRFGGKLPLQVALLVNGVVSFITPWIAMTGGWMAVCACRLLQGLTQAAYYPSLHTLLAKWVPLSERGRLTTYVYTGTTFGTVFGFQMSGLLAASSWGWPSIFWLIGVLNMVTFCLYTYLGAASPSHHLKISEAEKIHILGDDIVDCSTSKRKTPWLALLTSKHVWGLFATQIGSAIGFIFLLVQMPTYMFHILNVDIKKSGIYSSLPYIAMYFGGLAFGYFSDFCTNRKILTRKNARILCNSIAMVGPAIFMTACGFTKNTERAVACLVLSMGTHSGVHTGWMVNHIDLAPNFSGPMMAIGNTLGNACGLLLPLLVSNVVTDVKNQWQWCILFMLMSAISLISNTIFVFLMSADTQPWNYDKSKSVENKEEMCEKI